MKVFDLASDDNLERLILSAITTPGQHPYTAGGSQSPPRIGLHFVASHRKKGSRGALGGRGSSAQWTGATGGFVADRRALWPEMRSDRGGMVEEEMSIIPYLWIAGLACAASRW